MRLLWLLSLRLAATRADACAAATAPEVQQTTCNATALTLDCSEKYLSMIKCGGITYLFSRKELIIPVNGELVKKHEQRARVAIDNGWTPSMPTSRAKVFGVSENTAYACVDDVLVAYGGIGEPRVRKVWPHVGPLPRGPRRGLRELLLSSYVDALSLLINSPGGRG